MDRSSTNTPTPSEASSTAGHRSETQHYPILRWTIKGTMAAGEHRQIRVKTDEEKAQEFAQAKADLVKASASLKNLPNIDRRSPSS
ncbi:hypothetical protein CFO_g4241 [Ceratocystis platani]|uniref:Uncharacterized protein n=1 Tax=Ceratocystis fimbriata f. sp. platani TaxID=88771 RepID=A0A0F8B1C2_CERFI|nr:hypothetical protein CFO_g4241 [Ceratocystis platani]